MGLSSTKLLWIVLICFNWLQVAFSTETIDTVKFPTLMVQSKRGSPFLIDTSKSKLDFSKVSGISLRQYGTGMPLYLSLLGASIYDTRVVYGSIEWNDPRTNVANIQEIPYWKYREVSIEMDEKSAVQGGTLIISPQDPMTFRGFEIQQSYTSNGERKWKGLFSLDKKFSTGISIEDERKPKGKYPTIYSNDRANYVGYEKTSIYFIQSFSVKGLPLQWQCFAFKRRNDIPGLVGRAIESETKSSKQQFRTIVSLKKYLDVSISYVLDKVNFIRPQYQFSPSGPIPFTPFHEESKRKGYAITLQKEVLIQNKLLWKNQSSFQSDEVVFQDYYLLPEFQNNITDRKIFTSNHGIRFSQQIGKFSIRHHPQFTYLHAYWRSHAKTYHAIYPSYSLEWQPFLNVTQTSRIGISHRLPSLQELFLTNTIFSKGNPNLLPEESKEFQMEFRYEPNPFFSTTMLGYYRLVNNGIVWKRNSRGQYTPYNSAKIKSVGGVLTQVFQFHRNGQLSQSFSLTDTKNNDPKDINYQKQIPLIPKFQASTNLTLGWEVPLKPKVEISWFYQSKRHFLESNTEFLYHSKNRLPEESVVNLGIHIQPSLNTDGTSIYLSIENIFQKERWWMEGVPNQGRLWKLAFVWNNIQEVQ
ncbi:MAG: hypothetical protein N2450_00685 [bacterium]|nr:hypothetical protein [bacterium]